MQEDCFDSLLNVPGGQLVHESLVPFSSLNDPGGQSVQNVDPLLDENVPSSH